MREVTWLKQTKAAAAVAHKRQQQAGCSKQERGAPCVRRGVLTCFTLFELMIWCKMHAALHFFIAIYIFLKCNMHSMLLLICHWNSFANAFAMFTNRLDIQQKKFNYAHKN